jgi:hypothetical protein
VQAPEALPTASGTVRRSPTRKRPVEGRHLRKVRRVARKVRPKGNRRMASLGTTLIEGAFAYALVKFANWITA